MFPISQSAQFLAHGTLHVARLTWTDLDAPEFPRQTRLASAVVTHMGLLWILAVDTTSCRLWNATTDVIKLVDVDTVLIWPLGPTAWAPGGAISGITQRDNALGLCRLKRTYCSIASTRTCSNYRQHTSVPRESSFALVSRHVWLSIVCMILPLKDQLLLMRLLHLQLITLSLVLV